MVGLETPITDDRHEAIPVPGQPMHLDAGLHRQPEPLGVALEIVGELILRREPPARAWEGHPREPVEAVGGEEPQRVPAVPPCVADPRVGVEDDERHVPSSEVVPDRDSGLTASDDKRVDRLGVQSVHRYRLLHAWVGTSGVSAPPDRDRSDRKLWVRTMAGTARPGM